MIDRIMLILMTLIIAAGLVFIGRELERKAQCESTKGQRYTLDFGKCLRIEK